MNTVSVSEAVLIFGNPNSGKSLLFNRLTGLTHKVANFPGVTVEVSSGEGDGLLFQDYPGLYSLDALTQDEVAAVRGFKAALRDPRTRCVLYTIDATRLQRSLFLLLQLREELREHAMPLVVAVNVIDEVIGRGAHVDVEALSRELGAPVLAVSAKTGLGLTALRESLQKAVKATRTPALTAAASLELGALHARAADLARRYGPKADLLLKSQNRLDHFFLSGVWGPLAFVALMLFLFQAIFSWASPLMDGMEALVGWASDVVTGLMSEGVARDFMKDAIFGGVGAFLVFVPQIFVLFVIIGLLEDSGYLARAAVLCHRPLSYFGLSGRSFVPLLSGHACAIPAIMAARTIESPRKRLLTYLAVPFMSCSARLPVYALLIGAFVPVQTILGGLMGLQGLAFFLLYVFGIVTGLLVAGVASRFLVKGESDAPFIVEMPPYRWPSWRSIVRHSLTRMFSFVKRAGGMIFAVTVVIWLLGYFPNGAGHLETSYLGRMGRWIEPFFQPMGMDWKIGVAVLTSFLAREVFVGTLGTLYGIEEAADGATTALADQLHAAGMTLASAVALMVFYALAMQCVATLAVMRSESGKRWLPTVVFVAYSLLAYGAAMLAYRLFA